MFAWLISRHKEFKTVLYNFGQMDRITLFYRIVTTATKYWDDQQIANAAEAAVKTEILHINTEREHLI